jgi:DNA-binding winged helix-turn-helix (wHTH) protein
MDANRRVTFGEFCLDLTAEKLLCGDETLSLTPKAFAVLRRLVEDGGHLVAKEELLRAGWGKTHVSDGVLKVVILEIRRALGDDPAAPRFIETVARRGYRFVAARSRATSAPAPGDVPTPLVGRDGLLAELEQRLEQARSGQRKLVFLSGEPGIGKTTVLNAFLTRAAADPDVMIAHGGCLEHYGTSEAYYPVLEALGRLLREPGADRIVSLLESRAPTWLVQMPWVEPQGGREALLRAVAGVTKERMLREMGEALEALTVRSPLVLVLEDLHWSDHATLDLLTLLGRRQEPARLLVVGSYRSVDVIVRGHPLRGVIQELRVGRQCEDMGLQFLKQADVAKYIAQRFGGATWSHELAATVHQRTDGNPLFMVRLADELVALGVVTEDEGEWSLRGRLDDVTRTVPESLRELIDRQIARLEKSEQRVLEVAGLLGNQFTAGAIAAGLGEDPLTVEECCDSLAERRQLIVPAAMTTLPDGTRTAQYEFTHNLYPQVLAARVTGSRRLRLHLRVGEWLQQTYGASTDAISGQLAWHFEEAGDHSQAVGYLILTAENMAGRFAHRDAARVLQHARGLGSAADARIGPELQIEILERLGDAYYWLGEMAVCAESYGAAADRAADAGLVAARVRALSCLVRPFGSTDPERGIAAIEEAAQLSANCGDPLNACTEMIAGSTRLWYDRWRSEDWDLCASARRRIQALGDDAFPAYHRMVYAHLLVLRGNYVEALADLEAGIPTPTEPTSMMVNFFALSGKTLALILSGRWGEVMGVLHAGKEAAEKNGSDPWLFVFREAWLRTLASDFGGALRLCENAVSRATTAYPTNQPETIARLATAYLELREGKHQAALQVFASVLDESTTRKFFLHWYWRMYAQLGMSNAAVGGKSGQRARGSGSISRIRVVDGGTKPAGTCLEHTGKSRHGGEGLEGRAGAPREGSRDRREVRDPDDRLAGACQPLRAIPPRERRAGGRGAPGACRSDRSRTRRLVCTGRAPAPGLPRRRTDPCGSRFARRGQTRRGTTREALGATAERSRPSNENARLLF